MSNEPEEFEQLRNLLRLKRYELPPPRFFNEFSGRVLDGIAAEASRSRLERLSWLTGLFRSLERNAFVAGGFVTGVCALFVGAIVYSESVDQPSADSIAGQGLAIKTAEAPAFIPFGLPSVNPVADFSSSNSLPAATDSLFQRAGTPTLQKLKLNFEGVEKVSWPVPQ